MARRNSTPEDRNKDLDKHRNRVRRRYKVDLSKRRKFIPGEEAYVGVQVAVLKISGYSNTQIGKVIGLSRGQVKEFLKQPDVSELILNLRASLPTAAIELLQSYMVEAITTLVDVMRTEQDNTLVLKAAGEILDRGGVPKASRQERENVNREEFNINVSDGGMVDALRQLPPEKQEEAAQMMEKLESMLADAAVASANEITEDEEPG